MGILDNELVNVKTGMENWTATKRKETAHTNTKILATIGPASQDKVGELVEAGLDGVRFNMAHVRDYDKTGALINRIRQEHPHLFTVADLEGPKIRLGDLRAPLQIMKGQDILISPQSSCPEGHVPIQIENLAQYIKPGNRLLINDGAAALIVTEIKGNTIATQVEYGELLESRKGVNVPFASIPTPFIEENDRKSIEFLKKIGIDYVSASYTRTVHDLNDLRAALGDSKAKIIAKIENQQGIDNFDEILKYTDAVMVARGDLGMEIDVVNVPRNQKAMIAKCNDVGIPVITATQMLEGMMSSKEPKRAEISDIFNAVLDGTDVVMLSGETSVGQYPVETVRTMNRTLVEAEKYLFRAKYPHNPLEHRIMETLEYADGSDNVSLAVAAMTRSGRSSVSSIITPTRTGYTPRMISRLRLEQPIIALTNDAQIYRQLNMVWGVIPILKEGKDIDKMQEFAIIYAQDSKRVLSGDTVVVVSGLTPFNDEATNTVSIRTVL